MRCDAMRRRVGNRVRSLPSRGNQRPRIDENDQDTHVRPTMHTHFATRSCHTGEYAPECGASKKATQTELLKERSPPNLLGSGFAGPLGAGRKPTPSPASSPSSDEFPLNDRPKSSKRKHENTHHRSPPGARTCRHCPRASICECVRPSSHPSPSPHFHFKSLRPTALLLSLLCTLTKCALKLRSQAPHSSSSRSGSVSSRARILPEVGARPGDAHLRLAIGEARLGGP